MEAELLGPGNWHCPFLLKPSRAPTLSSKAARLQGSLETDVCCFLIIHPWELVCQLLQIGRNPYTSSSASFPFKPIKGTTQHILKQMGYDETTTNQSSPPDMRALALWRAKPPEAASRLWWLPQVHCSSDCSCPSRSSDTTEAPRSVLQGSA